MIAIVLFVVMNGSNGLCKLYTSIWVRLTYSVVDRWTIKIGNKIIMIERTDEDKDVNLILYLVLW